MNNMSNVKPVNVNSSNSWLAQQLFPYEWFPNRSNANSSQNDATLRSSLQPINWNFNKMNHGKSFLPLCKLGRLTEPWRRLPWQQSLFLRSTKIQYWRATSLLSPISEPLLPSSFLRYELRAVFSRGRMRFQFRWKCLEDFRRLPEYVLQDDLHGRVLDRSWFLLRWVLLELRTQAGSSRRKVNQCGRKLGGIGVDRWPSLRRFLVGLRFPGRLGEFLLLKFLRRLLLSGSRLQILAY